MKKGILMFLLTVFAMPALATVSASLDQTHIGSGESVQLTLQHEGSGGGEPDLAPLKQDFDILGRSSGSSIQIVNGRMNSQNQIVLVLSPKHSGKLTIPPLTWGGETTQPLTLTVDSGAGGGNGGSANVSVPAGQSAPVFVTATTDQKHPYVQSAVTLTVRLYTDQPLYHASLELEPNNNVMVQQLGQDQQSQASKDGREYKVVERKYLLFPQRSGTIRLDGPVLNAEVQDGRATGPFGNDAFFNRVFGQNPFGGMLASTKPIRVHAAPIVLDVRPRPVSGTGHGWLPAQKVTLDESWQPASGPIHVGDPITRHLHLTAEGLTGSQLPDLSQIMPIPPGLKAYPDQAKLDTGVQGESVVGTRDQDIALIANRSGRYVLPPLRLYWWDTEKNLQREIKLPARTLEVLPASNMLSAGTAPTDTTSVPPPSTTAKPEHTLPVRAGASFAWQWLSLALGLLWLATLAAWLWTRREGVPRPSRPAATVAPAETKISPSSARKAFRDACRADDPNAARRHLLDWARSAWYASAEWCGSELAHRLERLQDKGRPDEKNGLELASLYP